MRGNTQNSSLHNPILLQTVPQKADTGPGNNPIASRCCRVRGPSDARRVAGSQKSVRLIILARGLPLG